MVWEFICKNERLHHSAKLHFYRFSPYFPLFSPWLHAIFKHSEVSGNSFSSHVLSSYFASVQSVWFLKTYERRSNTGWKVNLLSGTQECQSTAFSGNIILIAGSSAEWSTPLLSVPISGQGNGRLGLCGELQVGLLQKDHCCRVKQVTSETLSWFSALGIWDIFVELKLCHR